MSNWKKVSLRDAVGKVVFDEEWGFFKFDGDISYYVGGRDLGYYYAEVDGKKIQITPEKDTVKDLMSLFSKEIYYCNPYDYYHRQPEPSFIVEEIEVHIRVYREDSRGGSYTYEFKISKNDKKRLEYLRNVWTCEEIQSADFNLRNFLKRPHLTDLKEGDEILYGTTKKYVIKKIFEQPNTADFMMTASPAYEGAADAIVYIKLNDDIYVLPYNEQPASEFKQFNTCNNEFALSPYAFKSGACLNVYWNKIDDTSEYTVSLYKKYARIYMQKVYHLKDYIVDRNDGFISIDGLVDDGYIVTVKAENRAGEEIAVSRGISISEKDKCVPKYWE